MIAADTSPEPAGRVAPRQTRRRHQQWILDEPCPWCAAEGHSVPLSSTLTITDAIAKLVRLEGAIAELRREVERLAVDRGRAVAGPIGSGLAALAAREAATEAAPEGSVDQRRQKALADARERFQERAAERIRLRAERDAAVEIREPAQDAPREAP